jgi:hypothetical protein
MSQLFSWELFFCPQGTVTCTDLDYLRLQKRLANSACQVPHAAKSSQNIGNFSNQQELQIVPNHLDHEDEPSVLTSTPCLPAKLQEKKVPAKKPDNPPTTKSVPAHLLKGFFHFFIVENVYLDYI